jgi:hypothetical protein
MSPQRKKSIDGNSLPSAAQQAEMQEPLLAPTANRLQRATSAGGGTRPRSTGKIRTISPAIDVRRGPALSAAAALNQVGYKGAKSVQRSHAGLLECHTGHVMVVSTAWCMPALRSTAASS